VGRSSSTSAAGIRVAGTTSGGSRLDLSARPITATTPNVFTYRSYIEAQGGADLANTTCGVGPQVGEPGVTVLTTDGTVDGTTPQGTYKLQRRERHHAPARRDERRSTTA